MTASTTTIPEIHTTDLSQSCMRRVQLTHAGKALKECTTALYLGLLFHEAAQHWHLYPTVGMSERMRIAESALLARLKKEDRPLTEAVARDRSAHMLTVCEWLELYIARFEPMFRHCKIIGVELPVRFTVDVDGVPQDFASHIDLLFRDENGMLRVWDFKTGDTSGGDPFFVDEKGAKHHLEMPNAHHGPTRAYIDRNMQMGMYYHAVTNGEVYLGGEWLSFGETCIVEWVDVRRLEPVKRATTITDARGKSLSLLKGDLRPTNAVVFELLVNNEQAVIDEFSTRVRMFRAGLFPTNPDPIGCHLCDCKFACPRWADEAVSS